MAAALRRKPGRIIIEGYACNSRRHAAECFCRIERWPSLDGSRERPRRGPRASFNSLGPDNVKRNSADFIGEVVRIIQRKASSPISLHPHRGANAGKSFRETNRRAREPGGKHAASGRPGQQVEVMPAVACSCSFGPDPSALPRQCDGMQLPSLAESMLHHETMRQDLIGKGSSRCLANILYISYRHPFVILRNPQYNVTPSPCP